MNLLFGYSVKSIDKKAVFPVSYLIYSFLQNHRNVGDATIYANEIKFSKGVFFSVGNVSFSPYGLVCRDKTLYYDGMANFQYPQNDKLFTQLVNGLMNLKPGYMARILL